MFIKIDYNSKLPIYMQIKNQIMYMVSAGELKPGQKLPSVRELASLLRVNPTSTVRSYRELEYEGMIFKKHGLGTFIAEKIVKLDKNICFQRMTEEIKKVFSKAHQMGLSREEITSLFLELSKHYGGNNDKSN